MGFGAALWAAMQSKDVSQSALARALGRGQSTVSTWIAGNAAPAPDVVFDIERQLEVPPGSLSHHLGYVPARSGAEPVIDAIERDPRLNDEQRGTLVGLFRDFTGVPGSKRGR